MLRFTFKIATSRLPLSRQLTTAVPFNKRVSIFNKGLQPVKSLFVFQKCHFHAQLPCYDQNEIESKRQMLIGFTCKVCEERSHHGMSRLAYTKGVVLIQCPGCKNRHLIADNLGWFKDSKTTVEDLVKEKGEAIRKVVVDEQGIEKMSNLLEWLPEIAEEEKTRKLEAQKKAEKLKEKEANE